MMNSGRKACLVFRKPDRNFRITVRNPLPLMAELEQLARSAEAGGRIDFSCVLEGSRNNSWQFSVQYVDGIIELQLEPLTGKGENNTNRFGWDGGPAIFTAAIYYLTNAMKRNRAGFADSHSPCSFFGTGEGTLRTLEAAASRRR